MMYKPPDLAEPKEYPFALVDWGTWTFIVRTAVQVSENEKDFPVTLFSDQLQISSSLDKVGAITLKDANTNTILLSSFLNYNYI